MSNSEREKIKELCCLGVSSSNMEDIKEILVEIYLFMQRHEEEEKAKEGQKAD